jgi:hypothetical protein
MTGGDHLSSAAAREEAGKRAGGGKMGRKAELGRGYGFGLLLGLEWGWAEKGKGNRIGLMLTVKIRQPSHEFTFGVGISFIPYPLVLTPVV